MSFSQASDPLQHSKLRCPLLYRGRFLVAALEARVRMKRQAKIQCRHLPSNFQPQRVRLLSVTSAVLKIGMYKSTNKRERDEMG